MKTKKELITADREMSIFVSRSRLGSRELGIRWSSTKSGILPTCLLLAVILNPTTADAVTVDEAFDMTVSEFSDASRDDQADTIGINLNAIHNYYTSNQLNDQAQCMMDLYKPAVEGGAPVLMHRILDGIDAARNDQKVSNVIITVVEKNCGQPASEEASE